jgi:hypothetical protein
MKDKAKKYFTLFMMLAVLVSSNTFVYYEHFCTFSKVKTLSFQARNCAGFIINNKEDSQNKIPVFSKKSCCELKLVVKKSENKINTTSELKFSFKNFFQIQSYLNFKFSKILEFKNYLLTSFKQLPVFWHKIYIILNVFRI